MKDGNELFELCKQVYEAAGWDDTRDYYHEKDSFNFDTRSFERNGEWTVVERRRAPYDIPLYTSDYLLEKLPVGTNISKTKTNTTEPSIYYSATCRNNGIHQGSTPIQALLKLTLKLHEEGLL